MNDEPKLIAEIADSWEWDGSCGQVPLDEIQEAMGDLPDNSRNARLVVTARASSGPYDEVSVNYMQLDLVYDRMETPEETKARVEKEREYQAVQSARKQQADLQNRLREMEILQALMTKYGVTAK